jgi:hypothetical protein
VSVTEPEYLVDFPTLGDLLDGWLEQHARVPDGFQRGRPFRQSDWQFYCTANHYRIRAEAEWRPEAPLLNQAFVLPALADRAAAEDGEGSVGGGDLRG